MKLFIGGLILTLTLVSICMSLKLYWDTRKKFIKRKYKKYKIKKKRKL